MLRVDSVSFAYGGRRTGPSRPVLDAVSFAVERGTIAGLLGPNGSGKTTLLRIVDGMLMPDRGRVMLDGRDVAGLSRLDIARRVAVVPQDTHSTFDFTALDIVLMGRYPHLGTFELEGREDLRLAHEAMAAAGVTTLEDRTFSTLSGGEKQRVVIAAALAQASGLLLLDEPTASLDLHYQLEIASLMRSLNRARGTTMLLSTHDLNLAASICSSLVLLRNGRVLATGPTDEVLTTAAVRELYGVEADVARHPRAGHLTVVPIGRAT